MSEVDCIQGRLQRLHTFSKPVVLWNGSSIDVINVSTVFPLRASASRRQS
jgi:hypothetical protein